MQRAADLSRSLYVNDVGRIKSISDVASLFEDEGEITNVIYESN